MIFRIGYHINDQGASSHWLGLENIEANSVEEAIDKYEQLYGPSKYYYPSCVDMHVITINRIKAVVDNTEISAEDALTLIRGILK